MLLWRVDLYDERRMGKRTPCRTGLLDAWKKNGSASLVQPEREQKTHVNIPDLPDLHHICLLSLSNLRHSFNHPLIHLIPLPNPPQHQLLPFPSSPSRSSSATPILKSRQPPLPLRTRPRLRKD